MKYSADPIRGPTCRLGCIIVILLIISLAVVVPADVVFADTEGYYDYYVTSTGFAIIIRYSGPGGDITIPDTLGGYPVVALDSFAFYQRTDLTSVTFNGSFLYIYARAFYECPKLTTVTIGGNAEITSGSSTGAFHDCPALTSVNIGGNAVIGGS
jgi:hypothetical protein